MPSLRAAYDPISTAEPSDFDMMCSTKLKALMAVESPQESSDQQLKRTQILSALTTLFQEFVHSVIIDKGYPVEVANAAGGEVVTSGSYRLGFNEAGMDIDTICIAPKMVTRDDFFSTLKAILEDDPHVEQFSAVEARALHPRRPP